GVFAEAYVRPDGEIGKGLLERPDGARHDARIIERVASDGILVFWNSEENRSGNPQGGQFAAFRNHSIDAHLRTARHRVDGAAHPLAWTDEQGSDQVVGGQARLANHPAYGFVTPETPWS